MASEDLGLIWVCVDCMLTHANGECGENPDQEPLGSIPEGESVTMGMLSNEHDESCPNYTGGNEECGCPVDTFSHSSCDGCGSGLYGERHAMHLWRDDNPATIALRATVARCAREYGVITEITG